MIPRPLFLYGTLLDPAVLARQAGRPQGARVLARRLVPARLDGWRRVTLRGTPYPTLMRDLGAVTAGAVLRADAAAMARLSAYEGASWRLVPVWVRTRRGRRGARAWVAPRWRADASRAWRPEACGIRRSLGRAALAVPLAPPPPA